MKAHPFTERFPSMEGDDFDELVADIKTHGLREPIIVADGVILDGRNRLRACRESSIEPQFRDITEQQLSEEQKIALILSANVHRRHLTTDQRRDLIADSIKAEPQKSDRAHARLLKVDHKTVGKVRSEMVSNGKIPDPIKRIGRDGKKRATGEIPQLKPPYEKLLDALIRAVSAATREGLTLTEIKKALHAVLKSAAAAEVT